MFALLPALNLWGSACTAEGALWSWGSAEVLGLGTRKARHPTRVPVSANAAKMCGAQSGAVVQGFGPTRADALGRVEAVTAGVKTAAVLVRPH